MSALFFLLTTSTLALADDVAAAPATARKAEKPPALETDGQLRLIGSIYPDPVVDSEGTTVAQDPVLDTRLRAGVIWRPGAWFVEGEIDLFDGQAAGGTWGIIGAEDDRRRWELDAFDRGIIEGRKAKIGGKVGPVALEGGLMTSHWGLGMLANDGDHTPLFGRTEFGDRVVRVRAATRPIQGGKVPLTFVLAGDRVVDDDTATWTPFADGDGTEVGGDEVAWQGIASVIYGKPGKEGEPVVGLYGVYRDQTETDGERKTRVGVVDLYGDVPLSLGAWELRLAAEAAGIFGHTDRAQSYTSRDGLAVRSAGVTGLVGFSEADGPLDLLLRSGWASGDGDPDDDVSTAFAFDRDFEVGMVLFDELQGAIDAGSWAQITDPENSGGPPEGAEALVGEGAFEGATFVQPAAGIDIVEWVRADAGVLFAWSSAPPAEPFETTRNGGTPTNQLGLATSGYSLGTEVDWKLTIGDVVVGPEAADIRPSLELSGGHLFASDNLGGGTHHLFTATGRVRW